jgi:hypothetical protein
LDEAQGVTVNEVSRDDGEGPPVLQEEWRTDGREKLKQPSSKHVSVRLDSSAEIVENSNVDEPAGDQGSSKTSSNKRRGTPIIFKRYNPDDEEDDDDDPNLDCAIVQAPKPNGISDTVPDNYDSAADSFANEWSDVQSVDVADMPDMDAGALAFRPPSDESVPVNLRHHAQIVADAEDALMGAQQQLELRIQEMEDIPGFLSAEDENTLKVLQQESQALKQEIELSKMLSQDLAELEMVTTDDINRGGREDLKDVDAMDDDAYEAEFDEATEVAADSVADQDRQSEKYSTASIVPTSSARAVSEECLEKNPAAPTVVEGCLQSARSKDSLGQSGSSYLSDEYEDEFLDTSKSDDIKVLTSSRKRDVTSIKANPSVQVTATVCTTDIDNLQPDLAFETNQEEYLSSNNTSVVSEKIAAGATDVDARLSTETARSKDDYGGIDVGVTVSAGYGSTTGSPPKEGFTGASRVEEHLSVTVTECTDAAERSLHNLTNLSAKSGMEACENDPAAVDSEHVAVVDWNMANTAVISTKSGVDGFPESGPGGNAPIGASTNVDAESINAITNGNTDATQSHAVHEVFPTVSDEEAPVGMLTKASSAADSTFEQEYDDEFEAQPGNTELWSGLVTPRVSTMSQGSTPYPQSLRDPMCSPCMTSPTTHSSPVILNLNPLRYQQQQQLHLQQQLLHGGRLTQLQEQRSNQSSDSDLNSSDEPADACGTTVGVSREEEILALLNKDEGEEQDINMNTLGSTQSNNQLDELENSGRGRGPNSPSKFEAPFPYEYFDEDASPGGLSDITPRSMDLGAGSRLPSQKTEYVVMNTGVMDSNAAPVEPSDVNLPADEASVGPCTYFDEDVNPDNLCDKTPRSLDLGVGSKLLSQKVGVPTSPVVIDTGAHTPDTNPLASQKVVSNSLFVGDAAAGTPGMNLSSDRESVEHIDGDRTEEVIVETSHLGDKALGNSMGVTEDASAPADDEEIARRVNALVDLMFLAGGDDYDYDE